MQNNNIEAALGLTKQDNSPVTDNELNDLLGRKTEEKPEPQPEKEEEEVKNRRQRRQERNEMEALKRERQFYEEANQLLNERIKSLSELDKIAKENPGIDPVELQVFGTDENGKLIKQYLDKRFEATREQAREEARREWEKERSESEALANEQRNYLTNEFEKIEESYNIPLLNPTTEKGKKFQNDFIDFLSKISPKDSSGEITEYADIPSSFETFLAISKSSDQESSRRKELASRSMANTGAEQPVQPKGRMNFKTLERIINNMRNNN